MSFVIILRALTLVSLRTLKSLRTLGTRAQIKAPICRQSAAGTTLGKNTRDGLYFRTAHCGYFLLAEVDAVLSRQITADLQHTPHNHYLSCRTDFLL